MQLRITQRTLLTPDCDEKSIYFLTLALPEGSDEVLYYQPGDWLTVKPHNRIELVEAILLELGLSADEQQQTITLRREGEVTLVDALQNHLEITQVNPAILNKMQRQLSIGSWDDRQAMIDYAYGRDILDLLIEFPELKKQGVEFLQLLSPLAPRYYSIASANTNANEVSILYRQVNYQREQRQRHGVATQHLTGYEIGADLEAEIKHNPTFKMPASTQTPIVMLAAGTGLAPFIGFLQLREQALQQGEVLAKASLYFGESTEQHHCLLCDQLQAWQQAGVVDLQTVFSRDQADKRYVQHRLLEQAAEVFEMLKNGAHLYICGSQHKLAVGVKDAMLQIFQQQGNMSPEQAQSYWDSLRKEKRLQQDVY